MLLRTRSRTKSCVLLASVFCAAVWAGFLNVDHYAAPDSASTDLESLRAQLSKHRTWTLVNPGPVMMDAVLAVDCAAPNLGTNSPHSNKYVSVYVNDAGRAAMMSERYPRFPQGSIIVKEKLSDKTSGVPELSTVMVKRGDGYDQANGNWEYLV